ncbi:MAG: DUF58 domain-containing protein [Actinomycetota bacterium]|nr:DUF58 domain-containing protein [Actinomycetota bacterium]
MPRRLWPRRVSVRPTARGWQAIFFGTLSLLAGWLVGTTQLFQLAYALAGLLLAALVLGRFFSRRLGYERRLSAGERFVAGRSSRVGLAVHNASRGRSPGLEVVDHLPKRRLLGTPSVGGSQTRVLQEPVFFERRGLYEFGPAEIRTTDPFGLLRFIRRFAAREEVVVYPEVFELVGFPLRGGGGASGTRGSLGRRGDEFSGLREYRRGDDRRHIHWKSVARTGELVVKEFAQDAPRRHAVVLDLHRPGIGVPEVEIEDAISAAGSVLLHLAREGLPFSLLRTDKERGATEFGDDEAAYWRAMDLLATAQADGDVEPEDFLDEKLREDREEFGESVVLVSRSLGDGLVESVRGLCAAGLSVGVVALAAHTYRTVGSVPRREAAFSEDVRRLELVGAEVSIVGRPGGVAALAGRQRRGAANGRGAV